MKRDIRNVNSINAVISDLHLLKKPITIATDNGDVELAPGRDKVYFAFSLLHSYNSSAESINSNGATFLYPLLARYHKTAEHSPLDMEHELEGSPLYDGTNRIVGHIIHADFGSDKIKKDTLFPKESHPVSCIGVLYGRISDAQSIIEDVSNGYEWRVSMEIDRKPEQDVLVAGEKIIRPNDDDWDEVLGKWSQNKTYDGNAIGLALGGTGLEEADYANLFGAGMVMNPADKKAKVHKWMMAPAATKSNNPYDFVAIAVENKIIGEEIMAKKVEFKTDGNLSNAVVIINGEDQGKIVGISIYGNDDYDDGEVGISWTKEVRDGDIVQNERYEYDPETATIKKGDTMGITLAEHRKEIDELKKSFANHKTPDEFNTAVADEKEKFKGFVSSDDAKTANDEAVKKALEARDAQDTAYSSREKAITDAKLELTDGRKKALREFEVSSDGDKEFSNWLKDLNDGQVAMADKLKEKKVDITDSITKSLASYDGVKDDKFVAFASAMSLNNGLEVETPGEDNGNDEVDLSAM